MIYNRRNILALSAGALALGACGSKDPTNPVATPSSQETPLAGAPTGQVSKVGIQTYTLREAMGADFEGTLNMIKDVGYDYVELNERNYADRTPAQLKAALDAAGLPSPVTHMGIDTIRNDLAGGISATKTLDVKIAFVPYISENERSLDDWMTHAQTLNSAGRIMREEGVKLGYHNHQFEFDDLGGGTTAMQVLMENTDPDNVCFELDIFWAILGKADPAALIARYPGRFKACHIKDMIGDPWSAAQQGAGYPDINRDYMVNVGEGTIDFESIFALNAVSGMEYFIAEHDQPKAPYRDAIATSLSNIRAMRF